MLPRTVTCLKSCLSGSFCRPYVNCARRASIQRSESAFAQFVQHFSTSDASKGAESTLKQTPKQFTWKSDFDEFLDKNAPCQVFGTSPRADLFDGRKALECGILEDDLRYRTTCYSKGIRPPYIHINEHRVAMHVSLTTLPLDQLGHQILRQVVGERRYDLRKKELVLQCNHFASRIENKRYLVQTLDKLILSCQRLALDAPLVGEDARSEIPSIVDSLKTTGGGPRDALMSSNINRAGLIVNRRPKPAPSTWDQLGLDEYK